MKDLNLYITEKLKINKNIKIDKSFKKGDKCLCISIHKIRDNKIDLQVYPTFKITSFKSDSISYRTKIGDTVTQENPYLNSNGYYQIKIYSMEAVFLHVDEAIEYLNDDLYRGKKLKNLLISVFDESNKEFIEQASINQLYSHEKLVEILDELESVKEERISEKFKINKDTKLQNRSFSNGDKTISISINKTMGCLELRVYPPFKVIQYSEKSITYKATKEQSITQYIFLNSNGYIQMRLNSFNAIFLSMEEGMDFLNNLILYYKEKSKIKNLLLNIFDKEEKDNIENLSCNIFSTENELKELYKKVKEGRIDEKLKINKDTKLRVTPDDPHKKFNSYRDFLMYISDNAKFYGLTVKRDNYWITLKKEDSEYPQIKLGYLKNEKVFGTIKSNGANPDELGKELIIIVGNDKYKYDHLDEFDFAEGSGKGKVVDNDDFIPNPHNLDLIMSYLEKL